ncbi:glutamine amidotransferase-like class 1 domain-containing protein 3, mitochondrial [Andrena cerasifolii]|uniref:glutamine amidotransferase-like class 1 domain-containing protein 3, mitochondrial n=1 Tax=Andrena cerasifolii TaxID=2819439 RepID=UPI004037BC29
MAPDRVVQDNSTCYEGNEMSPTILCGCGALDGTEISEAISAAIHLSQKDMKPLFYAPDVEISDTIDHCTREVDLSNTPRNSFVEAARLARSSIKPLCKCEACMHGGLVIPGGCGAIKTMSDFAEKGLDCTVLPDVQKLIEDFYCEKKPIASICIASVLIARVLKGVKVTLGKESPKEDWPHGDVIKKVKEMGAKVEMKGVKGITRCKKSNVLSTPAWMYKPATYAEIHNSIGKLIAMLKKSMNQ